MDNFVKPTILKSILIFFWLIIVNTGSYAQADPMLKVYYTFDTLNADSSRVIDLSENGHDAALENGANVRKIGSYPVLDLGENNGFLDMGVEIGELIETLENFSVALNVCIDPSVDLNANGNFLWSFANSDDMATDRNGNMFFSAKSTRYAISKTFWEAESVLDYGTAAVKGEWQNITYTQEESTGTIYLNGIAVKTGTITLQPKELGAVTHNYIGRSPYYGDLYLQKTLINNFRLYSKALSSNEVLALAADINDLNEALITEQLIEAKENFVLSGNDKVTSNIFLPVNCINDITISWSSSDTLVISNTGLVTRPEIGGDTVDVVLTASFSKEGQFVTRDFFMTVLPLFDDQTSVERDAAGISLTGNLDNLRNDLSLPETGEEGSIISWESGNTSLISNSGKIISLSEKGTGKTKVVLTATVTKGTYSDTRSFDIYIAEDEGYSAYLFAYFTGNGVGEEAVRFALSNDGFHYTALNNNEPVINSEDISSSGGVRDPHILRGPDGYFYMVVTDLYVPEMGWSNYALVLLKSADLINWTSSVVNIPNAFGAEFSEVNRVWAPQTIYDEETGKLMVYFSLKFGNDPDKIYYSYANDDFTSLLTVPRQLLFGTAGQPFIDADIVRKDNKFYLFMKTEGGDAGIKVAVSDSLTKGYVLHDQYLDQTSSAVEGSCVFKLINSDTYILMYDVYTSGHYQFTSGTDLLNFKVVNDVSMNFTPRHGTVIPVTQGEAEDLAEKWATENILLIESAGSDQVKKQNIVSDHVEKTVYLPVKNGTDLTAFCPGLYSIPGSEVSPVTPQDFTGEPVSYTVNVEGVGSNTYMVTAKVNNNPVLNGLYADPEVLYSEKTGKYYIYPTTDGITDWLGTYFKAFSSENLIDWTDEGVILDLETDVNWASYRAWAPTIIEKQVEGNYKYFFYFCGEQKIGVATASSPTGPFFDSGKELISDLPPGVSGGQQIDPDVFHDPVSGKYYLYWGNSYMAFAELNEDMLSINTGTIKIMTPDNTFREGIEVFYREGRYYFLWSENDTRSVDYRVRYATSGSPAGRLNIPDDNLVIAKDASRGIYGTGHNSVIHVPDSNKWYIVYHRFTRPKGITMGSSAGYNREVCIDELQFNEDGSIVQVKPTLSGIGPADPDLSSVYNNNNNKKDIIPRVFPNPSGGVLNISFNESGSQDRKIMAVVYDIRGKKLMQQEISRGLSRINIGNLHEGLYILKMMNGNVEVLSQKFIMLNRVCQ